jgi:hypothetical protein
VSIISGFSEDAACGLRTEADAFDLDDSAYAYLPAGSRVRLALVTRVTPISRARCAFCPMLTSKVVSPPVYANRGDSTPPLRPRNAFPGTARSALLIAPAAQPWLAPRIGEVSNTRIEHWDATHPLLSGVSLRDVLIDRAHLCGRPVSRRRWRIARHPGRADSATSPRVGDWCARRR